MDAFGCRREKVLPSIEGRVKLSQQPGPRRWLVFALFGALVSLSSILLLSVEEAQAKAKGSPGQDPVEKATGGSDKPAQKDNVEAATRPAAGKDPRGKETAKNPAAMGSTPRVDKPAPVDAGPKPSAAERAGRASGEVSSPVLEEAAKSVDRSVPDKTTSAAGPALKEVTSAAEPVLREADNPAVEPIPEEKIPATNPVLEEVAPAIEPVLERAAPEIRPVLDGAAPPVEPVLKEATLAVEPVLEEVTPPVEPILEGTASVVEPVLDSVAPVREADVPVTSPLLEATSPAETVEPVPEEVVSPAVAPVLEETLPPAGPGLEEAVPPSTPPAEPAFDTASPAVGPVAGAAAPAVEPGFGEVVVPPGTGELPAPENNVYAIPAAPPAAVPAHAPLVGVEARGALPAPRHAPATPGDAQESSSPVSTGEVRPSTLGLLGSYVEPFGRSSTINGHHTILSDAAVARGSQGPKPRPGPFGFPSGMPPPADSSLGGSGPGVALDLLGVLALFLILSRAGRSSWSSLGAFKSDSSLQLAVERPG